MRDVVTVAAASVADLQPAELAELVLRLPAVERTRAIEMRVDAQRPRFVVGRLLLRATVARVVRDSTGRFGVGSADVEPAEMGIEVDAAGRPLLVGPLSWLFVSIAHSADWVVVAVARRPVGVDVEQLPDSVLHPRLAARVCSPRELRRLERRSDADRQRAFMAVWARKEAYGKALGIGLDFPLRSVTVGPAGSRVLGVRGRWRVCDLDVDAGYVAAVVARGRGWRPNLEVVDHRAL